MLRTTVMWNNPNVLNKLSRTNQHEWFLYRYDKSFKISMVLTFVFGRTRIPYPEPMSHHASVGPYCRICVLTRQALIHTVLHHFDVINRRFQWCLYISHDTSWQFISCVAFVIWFWPLLLDFCICIFLRVFIDG